MTAMASASASSHRQQQKQQQRRKCRGRRRRTLAAPSLAPSLVSSMPMLLLWTLFVGINLKASPNSVLFCEASTNATSSAPSASPSLRTSQPTAVPTSLADATMNVTSPPSVVRNIFDQDNSNSNATQHNNSTTDKPSQAPTIDPLSTRQTTEAPTRIDDGFTLLNGNVSEAPTSEGNIFNPGTTSAPSASPSEATMGCCSRNWRDCDAGDCGNSEAACDTCSDASVIWLVNGTLPSDSCIVRGGDCSEDINGCCGGSVGLCFASPGAGRTCVHPLDFIITAPPATPPPTIDPSSIVSPSPSFMPSATPSMRPSATPSHQPSYAPSVAPSLRPSAVPTNAPSIVPTELPFIATPFPTETKNTQLSDGDDSSDDAFSTGIIAAIAGMSVVLLLLCCFFCYVLNLYFHSVDRLDDSDDDDDVEKGKRGDQFEDEPAGKSNHQQSSGSDTDDDGSSHSDDLQGERKSLIDNKKDLSVIDEMSNEDMTDDELLRLKEDFEDEYDEKTDDNALGPMVDDPDDPYAWGRRDPAPMESTPPVTPVPAPKQRAVQPDPSPSVTNTSYVDLMDERPKLPDPSERGLSGLDDAYDEDDSSVEDLYDQYNDVKKDDAKQPDPSERGLSGVDNDVTQDPSSCSIQLTPQSPFGVDLSKSSPHASERDRQDLDKMSTDQKKAALDSKMLRLMELSQGSLHVPDEEVKPREKKEPDAPATTLASVGNEPTKAAKASSPSKVSPKQEEPKKEEPKKDSPQKPTQEEEEEIHVEPEEPAAPEEPEPVEALDSLSRAVRALQDKVDAAPDVAEQSVVRTPSMEKPGEPELAVAEPEDGLAREIKGSLKPPPPGSSAEAPAPVSKHSDGDDDESTVREEVEALALMVDSTKKDFIRQRLAESKQEEDDDPEADTKSSKFTKAPLADRLKAWESRIASVSNQIDKNPSKSPNLSPKPLLPKQYLASSPRSNPPPPYMPTASPEKEEPKPPTITKQMDSLTNRIKALSNLVDSQHSANVAKRQEPEPKQRDAPATDGSDSDGEFASEKPDATPAARPAPSPKSSSDDDKAPEIPPESSKSFDSVDTNSIDFDTDDGDDDGDDWSSGSSSIEDYDFSAVKPPSFR